MGSFSIELLFYDQRRFEKHGYHEHTEGQNAQGHADFHPTGRISDDLAQGGGNQARYDRPDAFFDPDPQKQKNTGRYQNNRFAAARVEGQDQGAQHVHGNAGPDPRHQVRVAIEAEIKVDCRLAVMGRQVKFFKNFLYVRI